jgi:hypothetical protein
MAKKNSPVRPADASISAAVTTLPPSEVSNTAKATFPNVNQQQNAVYCAYSTCLRLLEE